MKNLGRLSFAAAVAFAASYACAAPKMYVAGSPGEPCKASYDGFVVEYAKAASNGDISVKVPPRWDPFRRSSPRPTHPLKLATRCAYLALPTD